MLNIFLTLIVLTTVSIGDLYHQYFILLIFFLFQLTRKNVNFLFKPIPASFLFYLPLICIVVWIYGILHAIWLGVPFATYSRNFASLIFYFVFYLVYIYTPTARSLFDLFKRLALAYLIISFFYIFKNYGSVDIIAFDEYGTSALRLYFSVGLLVLFVPIVFIAMGYATSTQLALFNSKTYWNRGIFWDFLSLVLFVGVILASGSKGFYLALLVLFIFIFILVLIKVITSLRLSSFNAFVFLLAFVAFSYNSDLVVSFVEVLVRLESDDLHPRVVQGRELIADFSLLGNGIGSSISSGYARDELGYGFELSYHNLVHKLGLFSFFVFVTIIYPFVISIKNIIKKECMQASVLSFSLMLYVIPAYGNPFLISPLTVTFNVIAFYLIFQKSRFKRNAL